MITTYFVEKLMVNKNDGASSEIKKWDEYKEALVRFHDACSSVGGGSQTQYGVVRLLDVFGNELRKEIFDYVERTALEKQAAEAEAMIAKAEEEQKAVEESLKKLNEVISDEVDEPKTSDK